MYYDIQEGVNASRFVNLKEYQRRDKSINDLFWRLNDNEFRQESRMKKE